MAKAGKKATTGKQPASPKGAAKRPTPARRKPSPPAGDDLPVEVEVIAIETVTELPARTRGGNTPPGADDNTAMVQHLREALHEAKAVSEQIRAARAEMTESLRSLKAEASAAAAEVAELKHQCKKTSEKLVAEIGEQSVAIKHVREAREQAEELASGAGKSHADLKALRAECKKTTEAVETLSKQTRTVYANSLAEAMESVKLLQHEVESLHTHAAEVRQATAIPPKELAPPAKTTDASTPKAKAAPEPEPQPESPATPEPAANKNRFGVTVAPGVIVAKVFDGSPAEQGGLHRGDVIEEANGRAIQTGEELRDQVAAVEPGKDIMLQVRRAGEFQVVTVHLGEGNTAKPAEGKDEADEHASRFGVTVAAGVVVAEVFPGSPAEAAGLLRGDIVEDANGKAIASGEELLSVIHAQPEGAKVPLVVLRGDDRVEIVAHLDHTA